MGSKEEKEGGFGWCITAASFAVHFIVGGISYSSATLHQIYASYFDRTNFQTAWIPSLILGLTSLAGIPSLLFVYVFGYRPTVILGGALATAGFLLSWWCLQVYEVYLTIGALVGIGFGLAMTPSILILESYFYHKHHLASATAISGTYLGILLFPVSTYYLEHYLAWKGMTLILGGICLNICLAGVTFIPKNDLCRRIETIKIFNTSLFYSTAFVCVLISNVLWGFGMGIIYTFLPAYSEYTGEPRDKAIMLIAVCGFSAFVSRINFHIFNQTAKLDVVSMFLCTVVVNMLLAGLHPELFEHYAGQIGYVIMLGLHSGFWSTFVGYVVEEFIGVEYMAKAKGFAIISIGCGYLLGPPIGGLIIDIEKDFSVAFYLAGTCLLVSSVLMMCVFMKRCHYRPKDDWTDSDSEGSAASGNRVKLGVEETPESEEQEQLLVYTKLSSV